MATTISYNTLVGVQFDAKAVEAITTIAEGMLENARGLHAMAEVFRASNVTIEAMIKVVDSDAGKSWKVE